MSQTIAICSLKGGNGKSTVCVNLALAFANLKNKTLIMDVDWGAMDVDLMLNDIDIKYDIKSYLSGEKKFKDLIAKYKKNEYISAISGNSGDQNSANMSNEKIDAIANELMKIKDEYDIVLIDSAPTLHNSSIKFCQKSDKIVIITSPEYVSLMDSYSQMKVFINNGFNPKNIYILVNKAQNVSSGIITFDSINSAAKKYLKAEVNYLGALENSKAFEKALIKRSQVYNENYFVRKSFDKFAEQLIKESTKGENNG
jgi:flagellar biosynthesis protein FlhG